MRRGLILFVGILALALAPTFVGAQYSGAFGLSGLPSMPSMFGGSGKCGDAASPGIAPAFYVGWGIPQDRNTSVSLTAQNLGAANVRSVDIKFPTNGLWLGAALPVSLTESSQVEDHRVYRSWQPVGICLVEILTQTSRDDYAHEPAAPRL